MSSPFRVLYVEETALEFEVLEAGGRRAHLDAAERELVGADFVIGDAIIELKILEEDGLDNVERQNKLVALFCESQGGRQVIVVDPSFLDADPDQDDRGSRQKAAGPVEGENPRDHLLGLDGGQR